MALHPPDPYLTRPNPAHIPWLMICLAILGGFCPQAPAEPQVARQKVLQMARQLLDRGDVSYVYGGSKAGDSDHCIACSHCLSTHKPSKNHRLTKCPDCKNCSLDCSHFIATAHLKAGLAFRYLSTKTMLKSSRQHLEKHFHLLEIPRQPRKFMPGDLLVYSGHVVLLEKLHANGRGDIIHSTAGRELSGPGMGIQRQRFVDLSYFHGDLLRVLRHRQLHPPRNTAQRIRPIGKLGPPPEDLH